MKVCVFSYNRGRFLQNAVRSVRDCFADSDLIIYDDGSTDSYTLSVLDALSADVKVERAAVQTSFSLGGLYNNMQTALDQASTDELVLFMQDDMQLVRKVDLEDINYIEQYFSEFKDAAFLYPAFLKGSLTSEDLATIRVSERFPAYARGPRPGGIGEYFAAVVVGHCGRLKRANWRFGDTERANAAQAVDVFDPMRYMRNPFLMYIPEVPIYRRGRRTLAMRIRERMVCRDVNRFLYMSDEEIASFRGRHPDTLPIAEDYLSTQRPPERLPYVYNLADGAKLLGRAHYWELKLRRVLAWP